VLATERKVAEKVLFIIPWRNGFNCSEAVPAASDKRKGRGKTDIFRHCNNCFRSAQEDMKAVVRGEKLQLKGDLRKSKWVKKESMRGKGVNGPLGAKKTRPRQVLHSLKIEETQEFFSLGT